MDNNSNQISESRQAAHLFGGFLNIVGFIMFFSVFLSFAGILRFHADFSFAVIGVVLIGVGNFIRTTAAKGLAGSGIILDPQQARQDLKPFTSAQGGMIDDSLQQIPVVQKLEDALEKSAQQPASVQVVKVRCQTCKTLNDEDAQFCKNCATKL